jgi:hypothetical protein
VALHGYPVQRVQCVASRIPRFTLRGGDGFQISFVEAMMAIVILSAANAKRNETAFTEERSNDNHP